MTLVPLWLKKKFKGFRVSRVQRFKGSKVQRFKGSRVQRFKGSRVQAYCHAERSRSGVGIVSQCFFVPLVPQWFFFKGLGVRF